MSLSNAERDMLRPLIQAYRPEPLDRVFWKQLDEIMKDFGYDFDQVMQISLKCYKTKENHAMQKQERKNLTIDELFVVRKVLDDKAIDDSRWHNDRGLSFTTTHMTGPAEGMSWDQACETAENCAQNNPGQQFVVIGAFTSFKSKVKPATRIDFVK